MKQIKNISIYLAIVLMIVMFASCDDWDLRGIRGEGPVISENIEIAEVQGIILEVPGSVFIEKGDEQKIRIDAQQNILDNINRTVDNGLLRLYFNEDVSRSEPIVVYMTINSLKGIDIRGSGEVISSTKFSTEDILYIHISGSGSVVAGVDAKEVDMNISGSGDINLKTNCETSFASISGSGDIQLAGTAINAEFSTSGSGDIHAFGFEIEKCKANIVGSGGSELYVLESLTANITGSGDLHYKGNPSLTINITGSGNIIDAN